MKGYLRDRQAQEKVSRWTGVGLTVAVHVIVVLCFVFSGFRYVWPPPQEKILIAFEDIDDLELEETPPEFRGETASEDVDIDKPVNEVRQAESPLTSSTRNDATASRPTPSGDVEIPATQETPLDPKAIFPGHNKRDTSNTSQGAKEPSGSLTPGQPTGGPDGALDGDANAHVSGWKVNKKGDLGRPGKNKKGIVVVEITIDDKGNVINARVTTKPDSDGRVTDTFDPELTSLAVKAAQQFTFTPTSNQRSKVGTVTCRFNLK